MENEAGRINLGINLTSTGMRNQISSMANVAAGFARKAFAIVGTAMGVSSMTGFIKSCLELGSNLTEVQNVVDTTFTTMSESVNKFAKSAMETIGMSEAVAKRYMGTFGAMSKAMGMTEKQAYDISEAVTKLTGDVASFFNLSTDEAYTKLKSIWTGETETLKDLGVVMTQTALDQYALNNGFGKTTAKMTEQEKLMLRYQYVMNALSDASGDFAKTSKTWANQTRVLSLRFDALKASVGQGFINLFTPVLVMLNELLAGLQKAADGFQNFTSIITGAKQAIGGITGISNAADSAAENIKSTGSAATSTASAIKRSLMGFDKITKLSDNSSGSSTASNSVPTENEVLNETFEKTSTKLTKLERNWIHLKSLFEEGFEIGLNDSNFDTIHDNIEKIKTQWSDFINDDNLENAASRFRDSISLNIGKIFGSAESIGITLMENISGGIVKWLEKNKGRLSSQFAELWGNWSDILDTMGDFSAAFADIMEVFRNDDATTITGNIFSIISDGIMNASLLASKFYSDFTSMILDPITENKDIIKEALEGILAPLADITDKIDEFAKGAWDTLQEVYDKYIHPAFENVKTIWSDYLQSDDFSEHMANIKQALEELSKALEPVLIFFSGMFDFSAGQKGQAIGSAIQVLGKLAVSIFDGILSMIDKFIENMRRAYNFGYALGTGIKNFAALVKSAFSVLAASIKTKIEELKSVVSNISNSFNTFINGIKTNFNSLITSASSAVTGIKNVFSVIPTWFQNTFTVAWTRVKNVFSTGGSIFSGITEGITSSFRTVVRSLIDGMNTIIRIPFNNINTMLNTIRMTTVGSIKPFYKLWKYNPITVPQIPTTMLAKGGIVKQPTLAMVGEAGKEAVMPLENNTGWIDILAEKVASKVGSGDTSEIIRVMKQILELIKNGGDTVLVIGDEEIARAANRGAGKIARRYATVETY